MIRVDLSWRPPSADSGQWSGRRGHQGIKALRWPSMLDLVGVGAPSGAPTHRLWPGLQKHPYGPIGPTIGDGPLAGRGLPVAGTGTPKWGPRKAGACCDRVFDPYPCWPPG